MNRSPTRSILVVAPAGAIAFLRQQEEMRAGEIGLS